MFTKTASATLLGLKPIQIDVEVNSSRGIPGLVIVGLPSKAVNEAKERVTAALQSLDIRIKSLKTVVNLAPADIRKDSSHLELAIAVSLLQLYTLVPPSSPNSLFLGELSLDGSLKPIRGALPLVLAAKHLGFSKVFLPYANLVEVKLVTNVQVFGLHHLSEYLNHARGHVLLSTAQPTTFETLPPPISSAFTHIQGQASAKRALTICAAGGHNLLLLGPPGTGKSALAESLPSLLPPLSEAELLEVMSLYSVAGCLPKTLNSQRPFRSPHHTTTSLGLLGGGQRLKPGEISLAHRGVLFLDEFPEFKRSCIEALRLPLETGQMTFANSYGQHTFPARFTLVAAANPCRCGYSGSTSKICSCSLSKRQEYQQRLSGPITDRIELHVRVSDLNFNDWQPQSAAKSEPPGVQEVMAARAIQAERYQHLGRNLTTAQIPNSVFSEVVKLDFKTEKLLIKAANSFHFSGRGYYKTLKVAQTIADLESSVKVHEHHLSEALQFRAETQDKVI